jgi:glycosyltransferase involved in cell wall biosynthesis
MKLVIVNNFAYLTGGADQHCFGLAEALRARGHEVRFLATRAEENVETEGEFVECSVTHRSREGLRPTAQAKVIAKAFWNREAATAMQRLLDRFRPDVVHAHKLYPQLSVAPVVVAARAGVPVVQTLHDHELVSASSIDARGGRWDRDESRFRFRLLNSSTLPVRRRVHAPRLRACVAVSRFTARVHASHGIDSTVIPNFVPSPANGAAPPSYDEREGVVFWGRLRAEKGVADVVELAKLVHGLPVTIVGGGTLEAWVRSETASLPNVRVTGFVPDDELLRIVRHARVVVIPSRCQEGGPLVPLESMVNGTPVVAYPSGGLGEYVNDSGGGRVVPIDPNALAAAAAEVHDDRATWERLSESGRDAIAEHHTVDSYATRLEQLYEEVA